MKILRKVWPGLHTVWGDVNWWRTRITGNIGIAITRKILGELIWSNYRKIGNRKSVITRKNVWQIYLVIFSARGLSVSVSVRFGAPGIWSDRFAPSMVSQRARILKKTNLAWTLENFKLSLEIFNLAWKLQSRLKFSILTWEFPTKIGVWWVARLKFSTRLKTPFVSISLEHFNPGGRSWIFSTFSGKDLLGWSSMCWLSWFSGPGCCSCPGFHLHLGASDRSPGLAFCFMGPQTFAWICCPQLPCHRCKNGTHSTCFYIGCTRRGSYSARGRVSAF